MKHYFRAQRKSISFSEMQVYISESGGDGMEDAGGVCACDSVSSLLRNTVMDAMDDTDEVIIFEGRELCEIYDGYRVYPVREIARFTVAEFKAQAEQIACEYERW